MNKARLRRFYTLTEGKYRQRLGKDFTRGLNVFIGYYQNNEQGC